MTIKNQENWEKLDLMMIVITKGRLKIIGSLLMTMGTPSQTLHYRVVKNFASGIRQAWVRDLPLFCISDMTVDKSFHPL